MKAEIQTLVQDIAIAMFKVAAVAKHDGVKGSLENLAIKLVTEESAESIRRAENLIVLARETGDIKEINASVLLRELANLKSAAFPPITSREDIDIKPIFSKPVTNVSINETRSVIVPERKREITPRFKIDSAKPKTSDQDKKRGFINPDNVFDYIKEHKVARLKELESAFNGFSGRTIRRVTESLVKRGQIERVGNPGPTSFYRLKTTMSSLSQTMSALPKPEPLPELSTSDSQTPTVISL